MIPGRLDGGISEPDELFFISASIASRFLECTLCSYICVVDPRPVGVFRRLGQAHIQLWRQQSGLELPWLAGVAFLQRRI